jgi:glycerol-3-phosphate acyltransferase PlsY
MVLIVVIVVQYVFGAVWYSAIFQKQWVEINHPEGKPSKAEMERLGKEATPYYIVQLVMTALTAWAQWYFISMQPNNWFNISFWLWLGFLVPGVIETIIWSDPKNKKKVLQTVIMSANLFLLTMVAGWAFVTFK